ASKRKALFGMKRPVAQRVGWKPHHEARPAGHPFALALLAPRPAPTRRPVDDRRPQVLDALRGLRLQHLEPVRGRDDAGLGLFALHPLHQAAVRARHEVVAVEDAADHGAVVDGGDADGTRTHAGESAELVDTAFQRPPQVIFGWIDVRHLRAKYLM